MQDLFDETVTPLKVGFWSQPRHWLALEAMISSSRSADEAEALRYEFSLCLVGERDVLGRPCLCDRIAKFPEAVHGGRGLGDSTAAVIGLMSDLQRAADELPLRWRETQRVFVVQGRGPVWRARVGQLLNGTRYRADRDLMIDLGRQHSWAWMAHVLGWKGRCRLGEAQLLRAVRAA